MIDWQVVSAISGFFNQAGWVISLIVFNCFLLMLLFFERFYMLNFQFKQMFKNLREKINQNQNNDWFDRNIQQTYLSQAHFELSKRDIYIKMLIMICPLLGLLGTVSGMVAVFDVLSITGTSNPRAMADSIGQATIPTMAGMVVAIFGLILQNQLNALANKRSHVLTQWVQGK
ncbi:MAG: MotA/TolQ/ExbB proton channel family protein [Saccharospirillaceae bacterium]|nr:MotA/TolQ/ExbB proton channel family protein [Pseudomonadales bacterium]NRB80813.1 MotA/TolQ/ExbB proton channel family protein [Saccharospirillaceae bacterium]